MDPLDIVMKGIIGITGNYGKKIQKNGTAPEIKKATDDKSAALFFCKVSNIFFGNVDEFCESRRVVYCKVSHHFAVDGNTRLGQAAD